MRLVSDSSKTQIIDYLEEVISSQLQMGKSVLWLVPGGSAMSVPSQVSKRLQSTDTSQLFVTLTDERYGQVGHQDENWLQLSDLGFVLGNGGGYRVLTGDDIQLTTEKYYLKLADLFGQYDFKIGMFGIGADGHTAGIKPGSVAVDSQNFAESFSGDDFQRITMTPKAVRLLDEVVAFAYGDDKHLTLKQILTTDLPLIDQPAQVLKTVDRSTLFSDMTESFIR